MLYIEPIEKCLMQLDGDDSVSVCNFKALHESIMATSGAATSVVSGEQSGAAASPVISGDQNTPLTNNFSGEGSKQVISPQHQSLPSSQNLVVKSSQHSPIPEPAVQLKAAVNDPIAKKVEKGDLGPCHSPKISPVNLDESFAAANEVCVGNHPILRVLPLIVKCVLCLTNWLNVLRLPIVLMKSILLQRFGK
jgi:hypothetical protein